MARNMENGQHSKTTTVPVHKEKTLVLRHKVDSLKKDILHMLPRDKLIKDAKQKDKKDAKAAMADTLGQFRSSVNANIDRMQEEILSHAPEEPARQEGQTEEEFQKLQAQHQQDHADFEVYADEATNIVEWMLEVLKETLTRLQEFSDYLWQLVKAKDPDIDGKCREFMAKVAKDIEGRFHTGPATAGDESQKASNSTDLKPARDTDPNTAGDESRKASESMEHKPAHNTIPGTPGDKSQKTSMGDKPAQDTGPNTAGDKSQKASNSTGLKPSHDTGLHTPGDKSQKATNSTDHKPAHGTDPNTPGDKSQKATNSTDHKPEHDTCRANTGVEAALGKEEEVAK